MGPSVILLRRKSRLMEVDPWRVSLGVGCRQVDIGTSKNLRAQPRQVKGGFLLCTWLFSPFLGWYYCFAMGGPRKEDRGIMKESRCPTSPFRK